MTAPFLIPPYEPRVHIARHVLRAGDTLEGICEAYGLSGCCYGELVGANLELGLTDAHVAPGQPLKLAGLRAGQKLKLPEHWPVPVISELGKAGGPGGSGGSVNPGESNDLDAVGLAIAEHLHTLTGDNEHGMTIPAADVPAYFNAINQWYRADMLTGKQFAKAPDWNAVRPYVIAAKSWLTLHGAKMTAVDREHLAWTLYPWRVAVENLRDLSAGPIDWGIVRDWVNENVKPGLVSTKPEPPISTYNQLWKAQVFSKAPWPGVPWDLPFSQIPAYAIPWGYLKPVRLNALPKSATPAQRAQALISDLALALGLSVSEGKAPAPAEEAKPVAPGGRPPGGQNYHRTAGKKPGSAGGKPAEPAKEAGRGWFMVGAGGVLLVLTIAGWVVVNSGKGK